MQILVPPQSLLDRKDAEEEVLMKPPPDVAAMEEADAACWLGCSLLQFQK